MEDFKVCKLWFAIAHPRVSLMHDFFKNIGNLKEHLRTLVTSISPPIKIWRTGRCVCDIALFTRTACIFNVRSINITTKKPFIDFNHKKLNSVSAPYFRRPRNKIWQAVLRNMLEIEEEVDLVKKNHRKLFSPNKIFSLRKKLFSKFC